MNFTLKNTSLQLLVITLNSGRTVHLAPKEVSAPMDEIEIKRNPQIEKMKGNSLLVIEEVEKKRGEEEEVKKKRGEIEDGKKLKRQIEEGKKARGEEEKKEKGENQKQPRL